MWQRNAVFSLQTRVNLLCWILWLKSTMLFFCLFVFCYKQIKRDFFYFSFCLFCLFLMLSCFHFNQWSNKLVLLTDSVRKRWNTGRDGADWYLMWCCLVTTVKFLCCSKVEITGENFEQIWTHFNVFSQF